ncbi:TPR end-of-group domain-containing protein [Crenothrix sp.]|uniref:TPR end-of-group domain-containing protein n=1 Tax=Crenothrix sp. TaxID=3100433 RepID=UPI00374D405A
MSLIASFQKKSKMETAIKQIAQARNDESGTADQLYKHIYKTFTDVVSDEPMRAQALYNWGAALLYQAKVKQDDEAVALYQDAISKFEFCLLLQPAYLAAAIDSGVAYMDMARVKNAAADDDLYDQAKKQFERANAIQADTASYNLACIYGLRGDNDACLKALQSAKNKASLPDEADITNDPDMASVKDQEWFVAFIESLAKQPEPEEIIETPAMIEAKEAELLKATQKAENAKYYQ